MFSDLLRADCDRTLPHGDVASSDSADIIDMLTMHPDARRQVARLLAEIDAGLSGTKTGTIATSGSQSRREPQVDRWGGQDLNLRPEDYESPALTD